jgi:hypothetical protein
MEAKRSARQASAAKWERKMMNEMKWKCNAERRMISEFVGSQANSCPYYLLRRSLHPKNIVAL